MVIGDAISDKTKSALFIKFFIVQYRGIALL